MNPNPSLLQTLQSLPKKSGIYQYYDAKGQLLYIGKAKNLHNRIKSYFKADASPSASLSPRIHHMVLKVHSIQTLIVENENDALILENSLIKQLKPRYNILLRDDKTYPYIFIDLSSPFPRPQITRVRKKSKTCLYFGPFCSGARDILDSLYEFFALVQKGNCLREKKACLFYQIERCKAPCENKISKEDYQIILQNALECLKDKKLLLSMLKEKMHSLATQERFEEAMILKERINKISSVKIHSLIDLDIQNANWDVFAIAYNEKFAVLVKLYIREGKIISSDYEKIPLQKGSLEKEDLFSLYQQAILSHYSKDLPLLPQAILLPQEFSQDEISQWIEWLGGKIQIIIPQRGKKKDLIALALLNAQEILKEKDQEAEIKSQLQALFEFKNLPHRIEIFDTSHHAGENNVGGMIVYEDQKWIKNAYRHYNLSQSDEYSQMREMLVRRAKDFDKAPPPDLWILDGGVAQLHIAQEVLESAGVSIDLLAIAKEKINHKAHRSKGKARDTLRAVIKEEIKTFSLLPNDTRLQFCQKLRDEAHRWAITFHRKKKLQGFIPSQNPMKHRDN